MSGSKKRIAIHHMCEQPVRAEYERGHRPSSCSSARGSSREPTSAQEEEAGFASIM